MRGCDGLIDSLPTHAHADERRHAWLLHCHTVDRVRGLGCGAGVVGDDDELCFVLEAVQHANEVTDVLIIERRVDFVKQAEGTGLGEEDSEEQGKSNQRFFTAREQVDALRPLAAGRRVNLDISLERRLRILEAQIALAAAKERHEDVAEVLTHLNERLKKELASSGVDLTDRLLERVLRRIEVVALGGEELEALLLLIALRAIYVALGAFAAATLVTLLAAVIEQAHIAAWFRPLTGFGILLGIVGVGGLIFSSVNLFRATRLSLANISEEAGMIRTRQAERAKAGSK